MRIPERLPGLRGLTIIWGAYLVVWAALEGGLAATVIAAVLSSLLFLGRLANRVVAGRDLTAGAWLLVTAVFGALLGLGSAVLTLVLMGIKTGIHAHGPEFSVIELNWVLEQITLWTLAGLLAGFGLGLLLKALSGQNE